MSLCGTSHAKLAAWHVGDPQFPNPRPWLRRTNSLLRDAFRFGQEALQELDTQPQNSRINCLRSRDALRLAAIV